MTTAAVAAALVCLLSPPAHAVGGEGPDLKLDRRWVITPRKKVKTPFGWAEGRILTRFILTDVPRDDGTPIAYPVGTITHYKLPKRPGISAAAYDLDTIAQLSAKAMGFDRVVHRRVGAARAYEQIWWKMERFWRMYLSESSDSVTISIAVYRLAYLESLGPELELVQRRMMGVHDRSEPLQWLERMLAKVSLIPSAHAGPGGPPACPGCNPANPFGTFACVACQQAQLTTQLNQIQTQIATQGAIMDANWDLSNAQWAETNRQLTRANDLLESTLNPASAFVGGLAAGAGMAAGAMAVSLIAEVATAGVLGIIELITHAKEDAERLEAFSKARQKIEEIGEPIRKLEEEIRGNLYVLDLARDAGGMENLVGSLRFIVRRSSTASEAVRQVEIQALQTPGVPMACRNEMTLEGARLDDLHRQGQALLEAIRGTTRRRVCDKLREDLRQLVRAEDALSQARMVIANPRNRQTWQDSWERQFQATVAQTRDMQLSQAESTLHRGCDQAYDTYKEQLRRINGDVKTAFWACYDERSTPWYTYIPIISIAFDETREAARVCREQVDPERGASTPYGRRHDAAYQRYDQMCTQLRAVFAEERTRIHRVAENAPLNARAHQTWQAWFSELAEQQTIEANARRNGELDAFESSINERCGVPQFPH